MFGAKWVLAQCTISHSQIRVIENAYKTLGSLAEKFDGIKGFASHIHDTHGIYYFAFPAHQFTEFLSYINGIHFIPNIAFKCMKNTSYRMICEYMDVPAIKKLMHSFDTLAVIHYEPFSNDTFYCHAFVINAE